jgi:hypothetical protein
MKGLFKKSSSPPARRRVAPPESRQVEQAGSSELDQRYNFRRNRTLTGSSSSQIASVSETKAQFKSPRVHAHELMKKRRRLGTLLSMTLLSAAGIYLLILQFTAGVVVHADGIASTLDSSYEKTIQDYLNSRPIERLRFLMNQNDFNVYVKSKLPEVAYAKIKDNAGFGKSRIEIAMREPLAGWSIQGKQQYVDASGTAFARNYFPAPSVQIVDNSGIRPENGQIASNRFLGFVGRAVGLAKAQGFAVTQVAIPTATTHQIELRLNGIGYPVKLSVDRPVGEQIEDMVRSIHWFQQKGQAPQYIDVRVSGKAFYR